MFLPVINAFGFTTKNPVCHDGPRTTSDTCKHDFSLNIPIQLESLYQNASLKGKFLKEDTVFDSFCVCFSENCNAKRLYRRIRQRNLDLEYQSGVTIGITVHP